LVARSDDSSITCSNFDFGNWTITKEIISLVVLGVDMIMVSILIFFVFFLQKKQIQYNELASKETVKMNNYVVKFKNMPYDREFDGKFLRLKAELWAKL